MIPRHAPHRRFKAALPAFAAALICWSATNLLAQSAVAQPPRDSAGALTGAGVLRGRVMAIGPGQPVPIRDARVTISGSSSAVDPVFTDPSGRFEFTALPPGRYTLTAEKTGFARTRYGSKNEFDPALPVDVGAGAPLSGIEIRMPNGAAIYGRVTDELGEPIVGAVVSVGFLRMAGTEMRLTPVARPTALTDDRGMYRVGGLAAGRYYVSIAGVAQGMSIAGAPTEWTRTAGWSRTFFPASPGLASATPIALSAGEERGGIDMVLVSSLPALLTITLADATGALAPGGGLVNLILPGDSPDIILGNRGVPLGPATNGKMTPALEPGDWIAIALGGTTKAVARVHLDPGDATSLTLTLSPGARMSGRVVFDGGSVPPALTSVRLTTRGVGSDAAIPREGLSNLASALKSDGTFEMNGLIGTFELQPASPIRGWTLRSVKVGERDLLDDPLTLTGNEDISGVQVIFTDQLADLFGTVVDANGRPSAGCTVALFPADVSPGFTSRRTRLLRADQNGRFSASDLATGSYAVAATPEVDAQAWLSADSLRRLRSIAVPVTLADREKKTTSLSCVSLP